MTREELYDLVWSRPMTKVSRDFGLSDVGLRKTCIKFNVPTPPLGYWAKLRHGKPVKMTRLPAAPSGTSTNINLCPSGNPDEPEAITALRAAVTAREAQEQQRIVLEDSLRRLHPAIADLKRLCKEVGTDHQGFHLSSKGYRPGFKLGREGMDRGMRILDTLARAAEARGHEVLLQGEQLRLIVNGEPLALRLHETVAQIPHTPTQAELQASPIVEFENRQRRNRAKSAHETGLQAH